MYRSFRLMMTLVGAVALVVAGLTTGAGAGFDDDDDDEVEELGDFIEDEIFDGGVDDDIVDDVGDGDIDADDGNVTTDLLLQEVEVIQADEDDDESEFVRFVFESRYDDIVDDEAFALVGVESDEVLTARGAVRDEDDRRAVIAAFDPGTDLGAFTLGSVALGAVVDVDNQVNPSDSAPIAGGGVDVRAGRTTGPDLVEVRRQPALERVVFVFDELLDEDEDPAAEEFGFYTATGLPRVGDDIVSVDDETVTVFFDQGESADIRDGVRFVVRGNAVEDRAENGNPFTSLGGTTTLPDLVDVDRQSEIEFRFEFDQSISSVDPAGYQIVTVDGRAFTAEDLTRAGDNAVIALFDEASEIDADFAVGAVLPGAAEADDASGAENTLGAVAVGEEDVGQGPTLGPDLEAVDVDEETGQVVFQFDEQIDDDLDVDPEDLLVVTEAGAVLPARSIVESDEDFVIAVFDEPAIEAAQAVMIEPGAVGDEVGNPNVGRTLEV